MTTKIFCRVNMYLWGIEKLSQCGINEKQHKSNLEKNVTLWSYLAFETPRCKETEEIQHAISFHQG